MAATYTVERSTRIGAHAADVFRLLHDFRRWTAWSPWEDLDAGMQREYSGPATGTGSTYAWSGNRRAGRGRMEITRVEQPTLVEVAVSFEKPFKSRSTTTFRLTPVAGEDDGTEVTWTMVGPRPLPMRLAGPLVNMDRLVGRDFEKGLARLKAVAETPGGPS
jgi:uncharacterized protein YndB with AHSA1/START domain